MQIFNSFFLAGTVTALLILFPIIKSFFKKEQITPSLITYNIIHTMLLLPLPNMFLMKRQLIPIGGQSMDDMLTQFETGLDQNLIFINLIFQAYLITLCIFLIRSSKIIIKERIKTNFYFFLIMALNVGVLQLEFNITKIVYLIIFVTLLLFGKFKPTFIKSIYVTLMLVYFYFSFLLIVINPNATIFHDGTWSGIFPNPNGNVVIANFTLILLLLSLDTNRKKMRYWQIAHMLFIFFMLIMSGSRNAQLTFILILIMYGIIKYKLQLWMSIFLFCGVFISFFSIPYFKNIDMVEITSLRWLIWENAVEALHNNFILGVGSDYYSLNNRMNKLPDYLFFASNSYSFFVDFILFYGLVGFILIIGFIISLSKSLKRAPKYFKIFLILFLIPNLFESYFKPPSLDLNNALFLLSIFIINSNTKKVLLYIRKSPSLSQLKPIQ